MSDISEKLLELAINSILHGSVQTVTGNDSNGNTISQEIRINDLRQPLVEKLATKIMNTTEFKDILFRAVTPEVIKKMQDNIISSFKFDNLPWSVK